MSDKHYDGTVQMKASAVRHTVFRSAVLIGVCAVFMAASCAGMDSASSRSKGATSSGSGAIDFSAMKERYVRFLTECDAADAQAVTAQMLDTFAAKTDKEVENILKKIGADMDGRLPASASFSFAEMDIRELRKRFFKDLPQLAKAYRTEKSRFFHSNALGETVTTLLRELARQVYHTEAKERDNWWEWEIGLPTAVFDTLMLMGDVVDTETAANLIETTRYFQPDAVYSGNNPVSLHPSYPFGQAKREATGGNRVDITKVCVLRGILTGNQTEIRDALRSLSVVWKTKSLDSQTAEAHEMRDGFYIDGSFIQHGDVPYTATYGGDVLLRGIALLLYLSGNTEGLAPTAELNELYGLVSKAFEPLLYKGLIPDFVSGRAITRQNTSDRTRGQAIADAIILLSKGAPESYRSQFDRIIKREIYYYDGDPAGAEIQRNSLFFTAARAHIAESSRIAAEPYTEAFYCFNAMERYFYRAPRYAIGIAAHSKMIANYETINKDNERGWYTGDGMVFIYDNPQNYRYFWHDADMRYIPGTTEIEENLEGKQTCRSGNNPAKGERTVGDPDSRTVTMDFYNHNDTLHSTKKWTFTADGLRLSETGITGSGDAYAVIEHKQLFTPASLAVNGAPVPAANGDKNYPSLQSFSVDGRVYVIETPKPAVVSVYTKNGRQYVVVRAKLGKNPAGESFAWSLSLQH